MDGLIQNMSTLALRTMLGVHENCVAFQGFNTVALVWYPMQVIYNLHIYIYLYKFERAQPRNEVGFVDVTSPATR